MRSGAGRGADGLPHAPADHELKRSALVDDFSTLGILAQHGSARDVIDIVKPDLRLQSLSHQPVAHVDELLADDVRHLDLTVGFGKKEQCNRGHEQIEGKPYKKYERDPAHRPELGQIETSLFPAVV